MKIDLFIKQKEYILFVQQSIIITLSLLMSQHFNITVIILYNINIKSTGLQDKSKVASCYI